MRRVTLGRSRVHQGPLILVNRWYPLAEDAAPSLAAVDARYPDVLLEGRTAGLLRACIEAVGGGREIVPVSGWRSREEQQRIWDASLAENGADFTSRFVALPGCSEHQTGLAIDLGKAAEEIDFLCPDFPYDGVCGAFRRRAAQYGFIQRYRREKEAVTGIGHESWHFRYVGAPHARIMEEQGLCLEEYAGFLRRGPVKCPLDGGRTAQVSYVPCAGEQTELLLPEGCCQISGDNVDGFIVTVWGTGL